MTKARFAFFLAPLALAAACGSRTGLLLPTETFGDDGGAPDAGADVIEPFDAIDDLPGLDIAVPPMDAFNDCPDAGSTFIYVITSQNVLLSFYPPTAEFRTIGTIACPAPGEAPFSMAVDREGVAYVVFAFQENDPPPGHLFKVSTLTAACVPTMYQPGAAAGFPEFGMGFSKDPNDSSETLYLTGDPGFTSQTNQPAILGSMNTTTFAITTLGTITPNIAAPELTGTAAGQLFAFYATSETSSAIAQINPQSAEVMGVANLPTVPQGQGWAFAFWGGDFYTFTTHGTGDPNSVVTRYSPGDGSITQVASTPGLTIVGAGVSTCAPQQ